MERSLELLAKVRAGTLSGKMLGAAERQSLVALLAADGLSGPEIAQILQVSDRTGVCSGVGVGPEIASLRVLGRGQA